MSRCGSREESNQVVLTDEAGDGLPERIDFFLFQPSAAWTALGLLALSGILAGVYPSWRGASQPIATTLRQEAVG